MTYEQLNSLPVWDAMPTITLGEMSAIKLMNRVDTKFVMPERQLVQLLEMAAEEYSVQVIDGVRACGYTTLYYDTADYDMYTRHHNQQLVRQKIRSRRYEESGQCFIEVKNKTNKESKDSERSQKWLTRNPRSWRSPPRSRRSRLVARRIHRGI